MTLTPVKIFISGYPQHFDELALAQLVSPYGQVSTIKQKLQLSHGTNPYGACKKLSIAFSENGKHFLAYDDFNWMIGEMDAFLRKNH